MALKNPKKNELLTEEFRSKLYKVGLSLLVSGSVLLLVSFHIIPVSIPVEYLSEAFILSFILISTGAILSMVSKMMHNFSYAFALVLFLVIAGAAANFHIEAQAGYGISPIEQCCRIFLEEGGCDAETVPSDFVIEREGEIMDCTNFAPSDSQDAWWRACDC